MKVKLDSQLWPLTVFNLLLGLTLWFLFSTDYSLSGTVPDIVFPPLVMMVGFVSRLILKKKAVRSPMTWTVLPSISGGCLFVLMGIIMVLPPFTLGAIFAIGELGDETRIQEVASPNGRRVATVFFRPVGAYSGGNGRIYVRVKYPSLPFVERDVYYLRASYAADYESGYLQWQDNNTLYISEGEQEVKLGVVQFEVPEPIARIGGLILFAVRVAILSARGTP